MSSPKKRCRYLPCHDPIEGTAKKKYCKKGCLVNHRNYIEREGADFPETIANEFRTEGGKKDIISLPYIEQDPNTNIITGVVYFFSPSPEIDLTSFAILVDSTQGNPYSLIRVDRQGKRYFYYESGRSINRSIDKVIRGAKGKLKSRKEHDINPQGKYGFLLDEPNFSQLSNPNPAPKEKDNPTNSPNSPSHNNPEPGPMDFSKIDLDVTPKTAKDQFRLNKTIEKLIDSKGGQPFSKEEKAFIAKYTGYGGLQEYVPEQEADARLLFEYYTPEPIVERIWGLAYKYGYSGGPVLEPSAGTGAFLKYAPKDASITAYELNPYAARILKILYPNVDVREGKFEQAFVANRASVKGNVTPTYDLVIGNPPFGNFSGREAAWEKSYTKAKNYLDYFIFRSLDLLKKDGLLVFIVGTEVSAGGTMFIERPMTGTKAMIRDKSQLLDAYRLPNGVFERTDVLTDIIVLRKT